MEMRMPLPFFDLPYISQAYSVVCIVDFTFSRPMSTDHAFEQNFRIEVVQHFGVERYKARIHELDPVGNIIGVRKTHFDAATWLKADDVIPEVLRWFNDRSAPASWQWRGEAENLEVVPLKGGEDCE
jgi:hypothetical protein